MVHGARRESLGGWNEISYRGIFGSISNSRKRNSKAREAAERPQSPVPGTPAWTPGTRRGCVAPERRESLSEDTLLADRTIERHAAPVSLSRSALTYIWISLERLQPVGATSAPPSCTGAQLPPHGRILDEHARTTNAPRQAPVNRSVSVPNAPVCPVGVTCAQLAVGSSRSREPTGNLHGNLLEIARSRRARLCL